MTTNQNQTKPNSMKTLFPRAVFFLLLILNPAMASAQTDGGYKIYLSIAGVNGSSVEQDYLDSIELLATSYQGNTILEPDASDPSGTTVSTRSQTTQVAGMYFTFHLDPKAYPDLFIKTVTGEAFLSGFKVTGTQPKPGNPTELVKYYEIEIKGRYESIAQESSLGDTPVVNMSVRPTEITITTFNYQPNGDSAGQVVKTWQENP